MGSLCSTSKQTIPLIQRPVSFEKDVIITPGTFVKENKGSFYDFYELEGLLGAGAWGEVRKCYHKVTNQTRVVKTIEKSNLPESYIKNRVAFEEANLLKKLDHPNLIRVYEFFEDQLKFYIIIEYLSGGDLFDWMTSNNKFTEDQIKNVMIQLLSAVNYLHKKEIVHRDIKPENILIADKQNMIIKLVDFDTATVFKNTNIKQMLGTPLYMAPEVVKGRYNEKCDIWSCGIIFYILLCGSPPYDGSDAEIISILKDVKINFFDSRIQKRSDLCKDLLQSLLHPSPNSRISASQACVHSWFTSKPSEISELDFIVFIENIKSFKTQSKLKEAVHTFIISKIADPEIFKSETMIFNIFDKNRDGSITRQEFKEQIMILRNLPEEEAEMLAEMIMEKADSDKSGAVDFTEFLRASVTRRKILTRENIITAFRVFDQDRSGSIEVEELRAWLTDEASTTEELVREIISQVDKNGDGKIDMEEFEGLLIEEIKRRTGSSEYSPVKI